MATPGTRSFIGPLTPAQQRRRQRSRENYRWAAEVADARNLTMVEAFAVITPKRHARWYRDYVAAQAKLSENRSEYA